MNETAVFTVGHSSRTLEEFLAILRAHGVSRVADVRAFPRSRRHPQYDREALAPALREAGIGYLHLPALGGHRRPKPDSAHTALPEGPFRGYADHMESAAFAAGLSRLLEAARQAPLAAMCAEARPEECHRSLLADALVGRGARVEHLLDATRRVAHVPAAIVRFEGDRILYAGPQERLEL